MPSRALHSVQPREWRERKSVMEEPGPIRWAPAGIDLSPAHLPPAVGPQGAEVALKLFLWQLQGRQRDHE